MIAYPEFKQQTVVITGAASGIGAAQTAAFLQQGAKVWALDVQNNSIIQQFKQQFKQTFNFWQVDVSQSRDLKQAIQKISAITNVNILLNTAGILDAYQPTLATSEQLWDQIMNTNLKSMFLLTNGFLPKMLQQEHGVIINMASIAGLVAGGGGAAYTAAKHGIIGYTKQLDYDYAPQGIRANCLAPGAIKTPMNQADFAGKGEMAQQVAAQTPARRWAQPAEVAAATLFIASQQADFIHGAVIPIDGGWIEK
ncbi:3-oxoacyl-ACP reductase [Liquorilactobacillus ghanensis]|uniref:3-oxoacyl-ACP reductase n=1 Tax=Liquorilactobacillus ghanensis TaxID=399370 RepID=UPI0039EBE68A